MPLSPTATVLAGTAVPGTPVLAAVAALPLVMLGLWLLQRRTGDAGVADLGWALGVGLLSVVAALDAGGLVGRYQMLRARWGSRAQRKLLVCFLAHAPLIALFSLPAWVLGGSSEPLGGWDWAGASVSLAALLGEATTTGSTSAPPAVSSPGFPRTEEGHDGKRRD